MRLGARIFGDVRDLAAWAAVRAKGYRAAYLRGVAAAEGLAL